jgi:single-strand DNA-binding protein
MSNKYEISGRVKVIFEPMSFASGFIKREFVLTVEDDYPQDIKFVCVKEKCALLDVVAAGDEVKVSFRFRGNFNKERYFVELQAFRIDKTGSSEPADSDIPWGKPVKPDDDIPPF